MNQNAAGNNSVKFFTAKTQKFYTDGIMEGKSQKVTYNDG